MGTPTDANVLWRVRMWNRLKVELLSLEQQEKTGFQESLQREGPRWNSFTVSLKSKLQQNTGSQCALGRLDGLDLCG